MPPQAPTDDPLLTVRETAARFRLSQASIRRLIDNGTLPAIRIGANIRVRESVAAKIQKNGTTGGQTDG